MTFLRAAHASTGLRGQVYGLFGGRSIGMGSGTVNSDLWMEKFGIDVEHIDEGEILRRADLIDSDRVAAAAQWLQSNMGAINTDTDKLVPEAL